MNVENENLSDQLDCCAVPLGIQTEIAALENRINRLKAILPLVDVNHPTIQRAIAVWGDESAWTWLCRPQVRLKDSMPLEAIFAGFTDEVDRLLSVFPKSSS